MDFRIIKSPSEGTIKIIKKRIAIENKIEFQDIGAIGLVQGKVIDMIYVTDIAEKAVGVVVEDIKGNCPQHMLLIGIFGDISSVESAINEIKSKMEEEKKYDSGKAY